MTHFKYLLGFSVAAMAVGAVLSLSPLNSATNLSEEGPFEIAQVVVIALGVLLWLMRGPADTSLNIFVATVGLLFLGRETSWMEAYGASDMLEDTLKYAHAALLIVTLAGLAAYWLRAPQRHAHLFRAAFRSSFMAWLILGCLFLLLGDMFEKHILGTDNDVFWEEWSELVGNLCFLVPPLFRAAFRPNPVVPA